MKLNELFKCSAIMALCGVLAACSADSGIPIDSKTRETMDVYNVSGDEESFSVDKAPAQDINSIHLRDKDLLYANEDDTSVVTMYLTVSRGNSAENTDHTWEEINTYSVYDYEEMGVERYQVAALLQVGDENGPVAGEVGYGEKAPNATVQIRGQTSSRNTQKNYKIELKDNKGTWNGQRTINLNKHQGDGTRFRNKLVYELLQGIPQIMSMRTQFVHLYVKDNTQGTEGQFEDYGLYTQVEQLNKRGLEAHGLDKNGHLYKINFFEFYRYEDVIMLETDPDYDLTAFEELLEVKGDSDHTKLIAMLDALNNYTIPIEDVLEEYFDVENIAYWMAFQILIGNTDTQSRNMYIYSPQNSNTWYIIPWDNDKAFSITEYEMEEFIESGSWEAGISNYWGNILFQRCLKSETFRAYLDDVIQELREYLSVERLTELTQRYAAVVKPYAYSMPDVMYMEFTEEEYDENVAAIPYEVEECYQRYLESLEKPMPFYIGVPAIEGDKLVFTWDPAYDLDAEDIVYTVELSSDYMFNDVIYSEENVVLPQVSVDIPETGQYFVRIRATNESGYTQDAFDYYVTDAGKHYGMLSFYVNPDGTIGEDTYEE
ncbi:spore coat protein H [Catenibacillus scindens]|uniref:Spore coat protein H n=1 Tax=Catenibacillus scindens TaxID=673271 RepID=A0A7W8H6U8_9FIRM|nr:CotH kinase family protein [Catenibacillus scindens]MBB5262971.1 spore coat protein H [Catenibacillus scindens]